jgi:hypothetical protein
MGLVMGLEACGGGSSTPTHPAGSSSSAITAQQVVAAM